MLLVVLAGVVGAILFGNTHGALAGTASAKDCSVCQFKPAIPTTTTTKSSSSSSQTHIRVVKTVRAQTRQYEKAHNVVVAIYQKPRGVASQSGCVDPLDQRSWHKKKGFAFRNTRSNGSPFWTTWKTGWEICGAHRVKIKGHYYMKGTKMNCGNKNILIPLGTFRTPKVRREVEFVSVKSFRSTYDKWVTKSATSTSTGTTTTTYSCDSYGSGWTLTTERGSSECKSCPPTPCPTPTPPPPSKAHAWLSKVALKDGANVSLSGGEFSFSITVNGASKGSTTNAASGSSRDLGQFNSGDSVQVCETNTGGYTPDQVCISHTMAAGENFTFSFTNRKTTPPPPSNVAPTCTMMSQPQNGKDGIYADGETFPGSASVTGTKGDPLVVTADSPLGNSVVTSSPSFTSNGLDTVNWLYTAPNDSGAVGQYDQITLKVTDTKTGLWSTCSTAKFILNAPPTQQ
jgi:hypothetical protein